MLKFYFSLLKKMARHRVIFCVLLIAVFFDLAYQLGLPILFRYLFDDGIARERFDILFDALGILCMLLICYGLSVIVQEWAGSALAVRGGNRLRQRLFTRLQALPPLATAEQAQGELVTLFATDVAAIEMALVRGVPVSLIGILLIVCSMGLLLAISWQLFLITLVVLPTIVLLPRPFIRAAARWGGEQREAAAEVQAYVQETKLTLPAIRLFRLAPLRQKVFFRLIDRFGRVAANAWRMAGLAARGASFGASITQVAVIGAGGLLAAHGLMSGGLLIAFFGLMMCIGRAVNLISGAMPLLIAARQAQHHIDTFLAEPIPLEEDIGAVSLGRFAGEIRFEAVGFRYAGSAPILDGLSIRIAAGRRVALVGASGSGKSTVLALLTRFLLPDSGRVLLDGHPLARIADESLRANVTLVPQNAFLFDASIRDNILAGCQDASPDDVIAAAKAAGIHDVILAKPQGYDTVIHVVGGTLSGGERQRIAVARALLRQAPVLLLDEATSALDPSSEAHVNDTLRNLAGSATVINVTHRLASIADYDTIVVMDRGRLAESGTHAELLAQGGRYAELWQHQQGIRIEDGHVSVAPERLARLPFLSECRPETLAELSQLFVVTHYAEGQIVFRQGDWGQTFYLIARGVFEISRQQGDTATVVATARDGDFFGELALVRDQPRAATVTARAESWCLSLSRQHFLRIIKTEAGLGSRIATAIAGIDRQEA